MNKKEDEKKVKDLAAEELVRMNLGLENHVDENGDLTPLEGKNACLLQISKYEQGYDYHFRYNLSQKLRDALLKLDPKVLMSNYNQTLSIINKFAPCKKAQKFMGYYFTHTPKQEEFTEVEQREKMFIIVKDGKEVSVAWAQEENNEAIELAVETLPEYRRKGFARQVVTACAAEAITRGKIAFYSFLEGNFASEALAKSLGVKKYAEIVSYS